MSRPRRRARGELEQQVLACLAAAGEALTPGEVLEALGGELAYTTVMTTMARLHEKGALSREVRRSAGRAYAYRPTADAAVVRSAAVAHRMRRVLDAGEDRAGVLTRFVAGLPPEDERLLAGLLADLLGDAGRHAAPDAGLDAGRDAGRDAGLDAAPGSSR